MTGTTHVVSPPLLCQLGSRDVLMEVMSPTIQWEISLGMHRLASEQ